MSAKVPFVKVSDGFGVVSQQAIPVIAVDESGNAASLGGGGGGSVPAGIALDGTDATGVTPLAGAVGIRGWLSGIFGGIGTPADAAWGGTGAGTLVALLKSLYVKLAATLSVTISGALPAGTNALGSVAVPNLAGVVSSNSSITSVQATTTASAGNILTANAGRVSFSINNPSTSATMYVLLGNGVATPTQYHERIPPTGRLGNEGWRGPVSACWSAADGSSAQIGEFSP